MTPRTQGTVVARVAGDCAGKTVLFGTDGNPIGRIGLAEATWIANRNARQALGIALTGMLRRRRDQPIARR